MWDRLYFFVRIEERSVRVSSVLVVGVDNNVFLKSNNLLCYCLILTNDLDNDWVI